jgi:hypothetical protein
MSQKNPEDHEISPSAYLGSTLGNAYFSGMSMQMMFEAVCVTHDESANSFCPQIRVECNSFKRLDDTVSAGIWAKERLDELVKEHGRTA